MLGDFFLAVVLSHDCKTVVLICFKAVEKNPLFCHAKNISFCRQLFISLSVSPYLSKSPKTKAFRHTVTFLSRNLGLLCLHLVATARHRTPLYVPVFCSFLLYEPISIISRQQTGAEFPPRCGLARSYVV